MSSQEWNCEEDFLQDIRLLSSQRESLEAAKASIELQAKSKPVKFQTTFGRGKKSTSNPYFSGLEDDPWSHHAGLDKDTSNHSPLGVRSSTGDSKEALGRAQKLAPYLETYKNRKINVHDLQKELKDCGLHMENSNVNIRSTFDKSLTFKAEDEKYFTVTSSDSEKEVPVVKKKNRKDFNLKFKKIPKLLSYDSTPSPTSSHSLSERNSSSLKSSESNKSSSPIPSCSNTETISSDISPKINKPRRLTVIERLFSSNIDV